MSNSPIKTAADAPKTDKPNVAPSTQPHPAPAPAQPANPAKPADVIAPGSNVKK
jgi:hypothetical protein